MNLKLQQTPKTQHPTPNTQLQEPRPLKDKIIILQSFENPLTANLVKTKLESFGVPCFLSDESNPGFNPIYDHSTRGVKLKIFEKDLERAKEILEE